MKTINYERCNNLIHITLDNMYSGDPLTMSSLDKNLANIINTEAPITLNTLKARLREAFDVKKISGKALDIIIDRVNKLGFNYYEDIFDIVIWPKSGEFKVDYLRINSDRLIYDIPYQEFVNLAREYDLCGEELYRELLKYFNLEVLTQKARDYLSYIESKR
ncbi:MAG: hypothetical protein IKP77_01575 [Acholeplasmatales bacterium]|nr:hypothetical protein [Acholeplasmatales bacterium]